MDALSPAVSVRPGATTAVVWASRAFAEPKGLLHALAQGGLAVVEVAGPYAALAELCRLERVRREHQSAGGQIVPPSALVLVYPEQLDDALGLVEAVDRFVPSVKCWMFGPSANPRLRPIVQEDRDNVFGPRSKSHSPSVSQTQSVPANPEIHVRATNAQSHAPQHVAPARTAMPGFVARATSSHAPRVVGAPPLRLAGAEPGESGVARFQSPSPSVDGNVGEMIGPSPAPTGESAAQNRPRQLLTTDELRMLLEEPGT